ncbi:ATP-dependent protease [Alicyclobacillus contaminans]|uniref:Lon protease family protein n=1 Tax=Alicyclobacillus contaminans TaxID=392016 RepID=UPI0003F959A5|nr:ATP-binding protein [Alicyclobacillus contaminans]GMA51154.1 ATP-dependent protease [Alicyclobacillus contaminans]
MKRLDEQEYQRRALSVDKLTCSFNDNLFSFNDTSELPGLNHRMVGQERAVAALDFGLSIDAEGYNVFVVGPAGTGKTTYTVEKLTAVAQTHAVPDDWCYVYNFQNPDQPMALRFPPGQVHRLRRAMEQLVGDLEEEMTRQFESDEYVHQRAQQVKQFNENAQKTWELLEIAARQLGIGLQRTTAGITAVPLTRTGQPMSPEMFDGLPQAEKAQFTLAQQQVQDMLEDTLRQIRTLQKEARQAQRKLDEQTASSAVDHLFEDLLAQFPDERVQAYLNEVKQDVIQHHAYFRRDPDGDAGLRTTDDGMDPRRRYQVNVIVDRQGQTGAPVVVETNPTYANLVGKVEYRSSHGVMVSDYTLIKPGALHQANGGYLVLQVQDLLSHPASWYALKNALKTAEIRVDAPPSDGAGLTPTGLRPEPIPMRMKVILIGTPELFHWLYANDPAVQKYFKVKAEFAPDMPRTSETCMELANFIASYTRKHGLPAFSRDAVRLVVEQSARETEDHHKLSARFSLVIELMTEASHFARLDEAAVVQADHVKRALTAKRRRSELIKEKVLEQILNGTIHVDTSGERVGQINGLAVLSSGDMAFGQPHRITARTYTGRRGVVNVERETAMSGRIHDKGLLILSAFLSGEFAQKRPLSISASIVFEQTYSTIDGDSASSTELYAILSSLANVPIRQDIAVTGSVDQFGDIQPIGGVNEKIEGFFYICKAQGWTGRQGVIIPHQNVKNLFLSDEVVDAVRAGQFHIWPVRTIREGIELLTGVVAGDERPYSPDTLFGVIERRLEALWRAEETGDASAEAQIHHDATV